MDEPIHPLTNNQRYLVQVHESYIRKLVRQRWSYLNNPTIVEDLEEAALMNVCKHIPNYDGSTNINTFLYVVAIGGARHYMRDRIPFWGKWRATTVSLDSIGALSDGYVSDDGDASLGIEKLISTDSTMESSMIRSDGVNITAIDLDRALRRVCPERYKDLFSDYCSLSYTFRELAKKYGLSPRRVSDVIHKIQNQLQCSLAADMH